MTAWLPTICEVGVTRGMKPKILANQRESPQDLIHSIQRALFLELAFHVGQHAPRHLGDQDATVHSFEGTFELGIFLSDLAKIGGDFFQIA